MIEDVVQGGTAERAGYAHVEWECPDEETPLGDHGRAHLVQRAELIDYFAGYLGQTNAEIDPVVYDRAA